MSTFDPQAMDKAANDASTELETIRDEHPEGVKAIEDWMSKSKQANKEDLWI